MMNYNLPHRLIPNKKARTDAISLKEILDAVGTKYAFEKNAR